MAAGNASPFPNPRAPASNVRGPLPRPLPLPAIMSYNLKNSKVFLREDLLTSLVSS